METLALSTMFALREFALELTRTVDLLETFASTELALLDLASMFHSPMDLHATTTTTAAQSEITASLDNAILDHSRFAMVLQSATMEFAIAVLDCALLLL